MSITKVYYNDEVFYIQSALVKKAVMEFEYAPNSHWRRMKLLQWSEFAVNRQTNELVKCRYELERIVDAAVETLYN